MPQRTTAFQRVVYVMQQQLAQGCKVTESAMLLDSSTGEEREVDIYIAGELQGNHIPIRVAIECREQKARADVTWIEQVDAKRQHLPIDVLILASMSGFTAQARTKAEHLKIHLWEPATLDEEFAGEIVGTLKSLWAKQLSYDPADVAFQVEVETLEGETIPTPAGLFHELVDIDGNPLISIHALVEQQVLSQLDSDYMRDAETGRVAIRVEIADFRLARASDGVPVPVVAYTYVEGRPEVRYRLRSLRADVPAAVLVREVPLQHQQLGGVPYAHGLDGGDDGDALLVVVTEQPGKQPVVAIGPYEPPAVRKHKTGNGS